jgi:hypothetical protein
VITALHGFVGFLLDRMIYIPGAGCMGIAAALVRFLVR